MSLAPLVSPDVRGVSGKDPPVERRCSIPGCLSLTQEGHHLWSRSFLRGQPTGWVRVPSGATIANKTGLCLRHHRLITGPVGGHGGWIKLEHGDILTYWEHENGAWVPIGPLDPQPQVVGRKEESVPLAIARAHTHLEPGETCESCGYTRPTKRKALPARKVSTWGVVVPDDAEIGAEVLDDWVEQFAALLGLETEGGSRLLRYHVLSVVLAWAMQHRDTFISDIEEVTAA
jgi:hypothetical protein